MKADTGTETVKLNPSIAHIELPWRIKQLPLDPARGYPVPWFVSWIDGKPEFRVADADKLLRAVREELCWVCGMALGTRRVFVIGPMCAVNRLSAEPPAHLDCARYSAMACPFLTRPAMGRREGNLPGGITCAGEMIERNPGVCVMWVTRRYHAEPAGGGFLFRLGEPERVIAYAEGRPATPDQVRESFDSGLPVLEEMARAEGVLAEKALARMAAEARALLGIG